MAAAAGAQGAQCWAQMAGCWLWRAAAGAGACPTRSRPLAALLARQAAQQARGAPPTLPSQPAAVGAPLQLRRAPFAQGAPRPALAACRWLAQPAPVRQGWAEALCRAPAAPLASLLAALARQCTMPRAGRVARAPTLPPMAAPAAAAAAAFMAAPVALPVAATMAAQVEGGPPLSMPAAQN